MDGWCGSTWLKVYGGCLRGQVCMHGVNPAVCDALDGPFWGPHEAAPNFEENEGTGPALHPHAELVPSIG